MKKFQMTNFDMPNNISYLKHALKSVTGLADVGVLQGDGDGPRAPSRCMEGGMKKFQMTNYDMKISLSFALLMFGFRMGLGMAPELHPEVWSGSG